MTNIIMFYIQLLNFHSEIYAISRGPVKRKLVAILRSKMRLHDVIVSVFLIISSQEERNV